MNTLRIGRQQVGHGLGGLFKSLTRMFIPVAKTLFTAGKPLMRSAAKTLGKQALTVGVDTLNDVVSGENVKKSLSKNIRAGSKRLIDDATQKKVHPRKTQGVKPGKNVIKRRGASFSSQSDKISGRGGGGVKKKKKKLNGKQREKNIFD